MIRKVSIMVASIVAMASIAHAKPWTVTVKVSPSASAKVVGGGIGKNPFNPTDTANLSITPNEGYDLTKIAVDGKVPNDFAPGAAVYETSFTGPKNHSLSATLVLKTFKVTTNASTGGKFSPATVQKVKYGASTALVVTPSKNNKLYSVTENGVAVPVYADKYGNGAVDLTNGTDKSVYVVLSAVKADHLLTATFGTNGGNGGNPAQILVCSSCHYQATANATQFNASEHAVKSVACSDCHIDHATDPLSPCLACHQKRAVPNVMHANSTYVVNNECANCHNPHSLSTADAKAPHGGGVPSYMGGSNGAQDNATAGWPAAQTSYLTRGAICLDCHGPDTTINAGFADGGHGKVSNDPMNAFVHYDWSKQTNNGTRQNGNCDRCHTAYGFMKFANQTTGYQRLRDAIAPQSVYNKTMANYQANNVLICIGCHKTTKGELRTDAAPKGSAAGALSNGYFALFSSAASSVTAGNSKIQIKFPGFKNSAICVPCHSGRSTDQVFIQTIAQAKAANKNYSTIATSYYQHGSNMGQTFIGRGAYDYSGKLKNYTSAANQMPHTTIKMGSGDTQGPCVGCHYSTTDKTHSLEVNFTSTTCTPCHGGAGPDLTKFTQFSSARSALDTLIRNKFNPLRVNQTQDLSTERVNVRFGQFGGQPATAATATAAYGAWYNWQILETYDRNAWVHNPAYARQILNDTLAYLQSNGADTTGSAANVSAALAAAASLKPTDTTGAATFIGGNKSGKGLCIACHSVPRNAGSTYVQDNNGVRKITGAGGEFQQWSHHIINDLNNSKDPVDEQCAVCHMEGTQVSGVLQVDSAYHMSGSKIHLRDCNITLNQTESSGGEFVWDPANPNHTAMDQFCMSCHNAAGAVTAVNAIKVPAGTTANAQSALNPFGDLIQNNYDGLFRNAVVAVYDQFDPNNTAHHAVRAPRYTVSTAGTPGNLIPAFANISANNAAVGFTGLRQNNGQSFVGTLSDTGKFVTTYQPLANNNGSFKRLADNSQLHCGDCHTVGQWAARGTAAFKAYSTAYGAGVTTFYKQSIGAHGSGNEYMLRNSAGDNNMNPQALVCYICHSATLYDSGATTPGNVNIAGGTRATIAAMNANGYTAGVNPLLSDAQIMAFYNMTGARKTVGGLYNTNIQKIGVVDTHLTVHDNAPSSMSGHCNALQNTTAGLTGLARLNATNKTALAFARYTTAAGTGGNGNAFGIQCSNCHNSGDGSYPGYGGIHGNSFRKSDARMGGSDTSVVHDATFSSYSTPSNVPVAAANQLTVVTGHKPYRFLPGLGNFHFNHGKDLTLVSRGATSGATGFSATVGSCYTLAAAQNAKSPTYPKGYQSRYINGTADDNGLFGSWGACQDHSSGTEHGGAGQQRNVLRPAKY